MNFKEHLINEAVCAREALKKFELLPENESRTLFIHNANGVLVGSLTDGDIRRGLLNGLEISDPIFKYMNREFKFLNEENDYINKIRAYRREDIDFVPVIDNSGQILKILDLNHINTIIPASALIMAGGRGERLKPFTDTVPKPMLIVGGKPIIEHNIDRLIKFGINEIFISVKYLSDQIKEYFIDGSDKGIKISYVEEGEPLGTIGALSLIDNISNENLVVMNSDLLTNIDFEDFFLFYKESNSEMTIASIPYEVNIPYAVLETEGALIKAFKEKPKYTYYSNAGIYFLKSSLQKLIPESQFYNATDLMADLISSGKVVNHYPMLNYWLDIGRHEDYLKAQEDIKHIKFS